MNRIDPQSLAIHLEVALACAAPELLDKLKAADNLQRRRATSRLAQHLADRLQHFEIISNDIGNAQDNPQLCFEEIDSGAQ